MTKGFYENGGAEAKYLKEIRQLNGMRLNIATNGSEEVLR